MTLEPASPTFLADSGVDQVDESKGNEISCPLRRISKQKHKKHGEKNTLQALSLSLYFNIMWCLEKAADIALKALTFLLIKLWSIVLSLSCLMYTVQWAIGKLLASNYKSYPMWSSISRSNSKNTCGTISVSFCNEIEGFTDPSNKMQTKRNQPRVSLCANKKSCPSETKNGFLSSRKEEP